MMQSQIEKAAQTGTAVNIIYMSDTGVISKRIIRIFLVDQHCMKAFCFTRRQYRTFKISNVLAIAVERNGHHESA